MGHGSQRGRARRSLPPTFPHLFHQAALNVGQPRQAGGLALGALLSPLATILPFVDVGLAKDADCVSLMNDAKTAPAPVKTAAATTPAKK